jgi:ribonuclease T2
MPTALYPPGYCNGKFPQFRDGRREYSNIAGILSEAGAQDTSILCKTIGRAKMVTTSWSHEWDKHDTCIDTLEPSSLNDYKCKEVPIFF